MKKKVFTIVLLIGIFVIIAIGIYMKIQNNKINKNVNSYIESPYENTSIDTEKELYNDRTQYNIKFLKKVDDLKEIEGKITDWYYGRNSNLCISTDSKVYEKKVGFELKELINSTKQIKSIVIAGNDTVILKHTDNSYSIYHNDYSKSSEGVFRKITEITEISLDNIVFLQDKIGSRRNISLINQYNDGLYVNRFFFDEDWKLEDKKLKMPLTLEMANNKIIEHKEIKQIKSYGFRF